MEANVAMKTPTGTERIRIRAYELFLARGQEPGRDQQDWLEAEREILSSQNGDGGGRGPDGEAREGRDRGERPNAAVNGKNGRADRKKGVSADSSPGQDVEVDESGRGSKMAKSGIRGRS
jgi:hypothetical protein